MGILRRPTAALLLSGASVPIESFKVTQSKTKKGDTFDASTAFQAIPQGIAWLTTATNIDAQVIVNGTQIFDGVIDHTDYDWDKLTVKFTGRDKGSALMDKTTSQKHLNLKPAEIVQAYAAEHGLQTSIDTPSGLAGKIFTSDMAKLTHRGSQWTYIQELADHFGMTAYLTGGTVYFKNVPETLPVYQVTYSPTGPYAIGNCTKLTTARNHILGRPVTTNVRSHNHKKKQTLTSTKTQSGSGEPLVYNYVLPGLTQDQSDRIAAKKHAENTAHELTLTGLEVPGDETVTPLFKIALSGTGTAFDQQYDVSTITHAMSYEAGYLTTINCKAKSKEGGA